MSETIIGHQDSLNNIARDQYEKLQNERKNLMNHVFLKAREFYNNKPPGPQFIMGNKPLFDAVQNNQTTSVSIFSNKNTKSGVTSNGPFVLLPDVKPLPPKKSYLPLSRNMKMDYDENFVPKCFYPEKQEKKRNYDQFMGMYDVDSKTKSDFDDTMLFDLIKAMEKEIADNHKELNVQDSEIYDAIATLPLQISVQGLKKKFDTLKKRPDKSPAPQTDDNKDYEKSVKTFQAKLCRVCFLYACNLHHEPVQSKPRVMPQSSDKKLKKLNRTTLWTRVPDELLSDYFPCDHEGLCNENCSCVGNKNYCEKFCNCSDHCKNLFSGCRCKAECVKNSCSCFLANRECDPNVCQCHIQKTENNKVCKNVSIQQGIKQHLLLGPSDVVGWGVFIKNAVEKDQFISEYVGEIISQAVAAVREKIYKKRGCSFLFEVTKDSLIDATFMGNKIRFANHSPNGNCYAKIKNIRGDYRVGIYAKHKIDAYTELLFDYGKSFKF